MKILVLSDTHIPKKSKALPSKLVEDLKQVDLIIHAGDWQTRSVYEELRQYAPVEGVAGNVDDTEIISKFDKKKVLSLKGIKIGVTHGDGKGKTTERRAKETFSSDSVDIIIFGHSHIPVLKEEEGIILFNPGSPTDKRRQPRFSYGLIILDHQLKVEHVFF